MKPKKPLRFRSKKTAKVYREQRVPLVEQMLADILRCERCGLRPPDDIHELKSRARGGSITDPTNLVAVCRQCHNWITTHPREAKEQGWSKSSWE